MTDYFCNHKLLSFYSAANAFMIFNKVERYSLNYSRLHLFNTKFICWWWIVSDCNGDLVKRQYVEDLWKLIGLSSKSKMKENFNHFNTFFAQHWVALWLLLLKYWWELRSISWFAYFWINRSYDNWSFLFIRFVVYFKNGCYIRE